MNLFYSARPRTLSKHTIYFRAIKVKEGISIVYQNGFVRSPTIKDWRMCIYIVQSFTGLTTFYHNEMNCVADAT